MPTETSIDIDLDSPAVMAFAHSTDTTLTDPTFAARRDFLINEGFSSAGNPRSGPAYNPTTQVPVEPPYTSNGVVGVTAAEIKTYDLIENSTGAIQTEVKTQIIHQQQVEVFVWHALFIAPGVDEAERIRIEEAFKNYVDAEDTNPADYATQNGISSSSYEALAYYTLEKTGQKTVDDRHDLEVQKFYQSNEVYRLKFRESRFDEVQQWDDGSVDVDDPEDPDSALGVIQDIVESGPASTCEHITYDQHRIGTLYQYPEFKIVWKRYVVKIGCVRVSFKLPQLWSRTTKRVLYALIAYKANLDQIVIDVILHCFKKAAIAGSILGLATANIKVAAAAFKAVFNECIKQQLHQYLECLVPDLTVLKEKGGWSPV